MSKKNGKRESNLELLRIVAMFFIICHHLIVHSLHCAYYPSQRSELRFDITTMALVFLNTLFIVSVNCYILISGFYGIKPNTKKLCSLLSLCVFYSLLGYLFYAIINDEFSVKEILYSFLPFSHTRGLWFVGAYFALFLTAPLLNAAANYLNEQKIQEWIIALAGLAVITFYLGYIWRTGPNSDGYNVFHFLFLYMIGRFLNKNKSVLVNYKYKYLFIYVACAILTFLLAIYIAKSTNDTNKVFYIAWRYNSPFIVTSSIAFFLFFASLKIKSHVINTIAASTFSVYLIHENVYLRNYLYTYFNDYASGRPSLYVINLIFICAGCIFFCAIFIDLLRKNILPSNLK